MIQDRNTFFTLSMVHFKEDQLSICMKINALREVIWTSNLIFGLKTEDISD